MMSENALPAPRRSPAAADEPTALHAPMAAGAAPAPPRSTGCFPPRLEISPLTIRPAAPLATDRDLERRPLF